MDKKVSDALWQLFLKTGDPLYLNTRAALEQREHYKRKGRGTQD